MGEAQELQPEPHINVQMTIKKTEDEVENSSDNTEINKNVSNFPRLKQYKWWLQVSIYAIFVLAGQSVGTLLGRLYFDNGGKSKLIATLVQVVGFPVLFPFQWITRTKKVQTETNTHDPFPMILFLIYVALGIFVAADCLLYSIGLQYLPVTTYTLICASQLGFNAVFSFFLNRQKFTPYIVNSLVLLTISSILLVFQTDDESNKTSKNKYVIGFLSTIGASAGYAIVLSTTQLTFQKIIKKETLQAVIHLSIYVSMVASIVILVALFASGDWRKLKKEMENYKLGQASYVMNLVGTAVSWQAFGVGCNGLIFKVSSLFSNVISIAGLPLAPIFAVIFLHEKLTGLKAVSMLLAVWGFVSYMYQHYLEDLEMKEKKRRSSDEVGIMNERG